MFVSYFYVLVAFFSPSPILSLFRASYQFNKSLKIPSFILSAGVCKINTAKIVIFNPPYRVRFVIPSGNRKLVPLSIHINNQSFRRSLSYNLYAVSFIARAASRTGHKQNNQSGYDYANYPKFNFVCHLISFHGPGRNRTFRSLPRCRL